MFALTVEIPTKRVEEFCDRWKVREFSLFGSALREDFGPESDVDVLVTFDEDARWSLYEWIEMRDELEQLFGRQVDLVESSSLRNPFRRHEILKTRQVLHARR